MISVYFWDTFNSECQNTQVVTAAAVQGYGAVGWCCFRRQKSPFFSFCFS